MILKARPSFGLVKREDKAGRLAAFIDEFLARVAKEPRSVLRPVLLLARSAESPVARAVMSISSHDVGRSLAVRAIFATLGTADTACIAEAYRSSSSALQIRWARDIRLMDAHEQLVLDDETSWIGDCMRREPLRHDAFEAFSAGCAGTARSVTVFFERLWQASEPIIDRKASAETVAGEIMAPPPPIDQPTPVVLKN
jgi:hypothetical protein